MEFPCGDRQTGKKPTSLSFSYLHHKAPPTCKCQLCVLPFPELKRDLSLSEVFLGPLMLQFKNCLHKEKKSQIFMGANEDMSISFQSKALKVKQVLCFVVEAPEGCCRQQELLCESD